ncbi:HAD-IA family hydrolase [uncultured Photobacterium sp.]|uniref:HAD-IA family hydrolase n=1 Tax=uncultured Photobacterium sp. TaxID=173973 RepID=UPI002611C14F|nr:HAD-IA family hydrolase [uncultured Photobacterium sp.]
MVLIFDFDGTIADTFNLYIDVMRKIHHEYDFKYIHDEDIELCRAMTSKEIIHYLGISPLQIPIIAHRIRGDFTKRMKEQKIFTGVASVLESLKQEGHKLFILSSNSEENINIFLGLNNITQFDGVFSKSSIFGKSGIIKKIINKNRFIADNVHYIGDETRDIEAAKKINIKSIAVSWGYNNRKALLDKNPDYIIDKPQQLISLFSV